MVFGPRLFLSYYVTPLHVTLTLLAAYKAQDVGWRKVLVAVTLHCPGFSHVAAPVCLGASRQREGIPPGCHMQVKSRFVTSEEQEQISRTASSLCLLFTVLGTLGSGSGLNCLSNSLLL